MLVPDLEAAPAYCALLGAEGEPAGVRCRGARRSPLQYVWEQWIDLAQPCRNFGASIEDHAAGPYEIILVTQTAGHAPMTPELAHGAHIRFDSPE
ncbi:MAG: hypothetical protein U0075_10120 [Thermomicrobiales bacterium]